MPAHKLPATHLPATDSQDYPFDLARDRPAALRRRHDRVATDIPAILHVRGHFRGVTIRNIAPGGASLRGGFALYRGDPVDIELLNGRRLPGRIAWSLGDRCGVAFAESLPSDDPLLSEAAWGSARKCARSGAKPNPGDDRSSPAPKNNASGKSGA